MLSRIVEPTKAIDTYIKQQYSNKINVGSINESRSTAFAHFIKDS